MNRIYRSIWNQATGAYAAVSENVKSAGKRSLPGCSGGGAHFALTSMAAALMLGYGSLALAGPAGGTVVAGQASIHGAPGATVIQQGSQNAVINWASFNIGKGESVQFQQPNSNAVALNRVLGGDGTTILGNLSANGKVFIVNPNGVLFGKGASVNTAGLVASTLDISNNDFMSGKYQFSGSGTGKVLNQGSISAPGGYVALLGANVSNEGTIQARLGSVALAAGKAITLDVAGDGLLNVAVDRGAVGALVNNGGLIQADGGTVVLSAQAAGDLLKTVVNNTGVIEAHTIATRGGTIKLLGDMQSGTVNAAGTLDASAPAGAVGSRGGFIDTSAAHVKIADGLKVTTAAPQGLSGTWLIDPSDFNIAVSGGDMTGAFLSNSLKSGNVQIQSVSGGSGTQGNINVNDNVNWSANKLTLTAQNNININRAMRGAGTASLALEYGQSGVAAGNLSTYNVKAEVDLPSGNNFSTKLGSNGGVVVYQVINSLGAFNSSSGSDVQGMQGNLSGKYVLGSNIDARATGSWDSGKGFMPIGNDTTPFTGTLDGLGHEIIGLTINRPEMAIGMFGNIGTGGAVRNMGLGNVSVAGSVAAYASSSYAGIGALAAVNNGKIDNVYSSGAVSGSGYVNLGGLVGINTGTISNSRVSGTVVSAGNPGPGGYGAAGGFVGLNDVGGLIKNSSSSATTSSLRYVAAGLVATNSGAISDSFATGNVNAGGNYGGGLVSFNNGSISNSYATGATNGTGSAGGLVGINNDSSATISNSYATGKVTSNGGYVGGLVGLLRGTLSNSYVTGDVQTTGLAGGVVGYNVSGTITNVYTTGKVTGGGASVGAIVGEHNNGSVNRAYFDSTINSGLNGIGQSFNGATSNAQGLSTAQMLVSSNYVGFNFTSTGGASGNNWVAVSADGTLNGGTGTRPMLASEWSAIINSAHQLQLMAMNKTASYTLGSSFSAGTTAANGKDIWGTTGFIPVGTAGSPFTGSLDGAGHIISSLNIAKNGVSNVGLFGAIGSAGSVANVGLSGGSVAGGTNVGALAGSNAGTISGSFVTSDVNSTSTGGGLVGSNTGTVTDSYASGAVNGTATVGGLVGSNSGSIANSYANGSVSGVSNVGGLVGSSAGGVTGSYWDMLSSSQAASMGGTGLTTAQLKNLSNYTGAGWELAQMWVVYNGQSAPFLRSFMKTVAVRVSQDSKVYDGLAYAGGNSSVTYSNAVAGESLLGTTVYGGNAAGAVNAGSYGVSASGLYSTGGQSGYAISYIDGGLVITPKQISLTGASAGSKVYDGTTSATISGGALAGLVAGDVGNVTFSSTGTYISKNVGSGIAVNASATLGGSAAGNYTLASLAGITGDITPASITSINGILAGNKVYDGLADATLNTGAAVLSGKFNGDVLTVSGTGTFDSKNAGTGKTVNLSGLVLGGADAGNYVLSNTTTNSVTADITAKTLTLSSIADKVYDGSSKASFSQGVLNGLVGSEVLDISGSGSYADKNAGIGKAFTVNAATLADAGSGASAGMASNYVLATPSGVTGTVSKASINGVTGIVAQTRAYDGTADATLDTGSAAYTGMVNGDSLTFSAATAVFNDKNAGSKTVSVNGIVLGGADAGNYTLGNATASGSGTITAKTLTLSSIADKVYDGSSKASFSQGVLNGLVGSEVLDISGSGSYADKNAGIGKAFTVNAATLADAGSGASAGMASNYVLATPSGVTGTVSKASINGVTGIVAQTRAYDGTADATLDTGSAAYTGMVNGDSLTFSAATAVFNDKNAGSKTVSVNGIVLGGADAGNYTLGNATASGSGTITAKTLTLSSIADKVYDGSSKASFSQGVLNGLVGSEVLDISGSGSYVDKNAGVGKAFTVNAATLADAGSGASAGMASNYVLATPSGVTGTVSKASINGVTGIVAQTRAYDGTADATLDTGSAAYTGMVNGDSLTFSAATAVFNDKNAGSKTVSVTGIVLGGADAGNYTLGNATASGSGTITAKTLTLSSIADKVYDGSSKASFSQGVLNGLVGSEVLDISGSGSYADKNAGIGKAFTVNAATLADAGSGASAGLASNYVLATPSGVTGTVSKASINGVTGIVAHTRAYDGTADATLDTGSAAYTGMVNGDSLTFSAATAVFNDKNAGSKTVSVNGIVLGGADAGNYTLGNATASGSGTITAKTLTLSSIADKVYDGSSKASFSQGVLNGLVGSEVLDISGSGSYADKNAGIGKAFTVNAATLADAGSGASAGMASNYVLATPSGVTGTVSKASINGVTGIVAQTRAYDGTADATLDTGSAAYTGMVNGDSLTFSAATAVFNDKNAGSKTVSVNGIVLGGADAGNYTLGNATASGSGTITAKTLTLSSIADKVYDGSSKASFSQGVLNGLVGSEVLDISGSGSYADKNAGIGKAFTVNAATLADAGSGASAGMASNYVLAMPSGVTGTVSKASINGVTGIVANNKVYDGNALASLNTGSAAFTGMVGGDNLVVTGASGSFADKNAASGKTVSVTGIALGGTDAGNYTLLNSTASTTADIAKASIANVAGITANNKDYDGNALASLNTGSASFTGMVGGDNLTVATATGSFADKNAASGKTVSVTGIALGGTDAGNYVLASNTASTTADIAKASISAVAGITAGNKVYDGNTLASLNTGSASFTGMVGGDNLAVATATGSFANKNAANGKTVSVTGIALGGTDAGNYTLLNSTASTTADIAKASIANVAGITANNKVYDGNALASLNTGSAAFTGMIGGDNLTVSNATGSFGDKNAASGKTVSVTGIVLGGTDAGNYVLASNTASTTADIAKASISAVGGITANSKVYDGNALASLNTGSAAFTGMVGGDSLTVATATGSFADKNAASGKTVSVTGIALGGTDAGNYTLLNSTASTTADIAKASISAVGGITANSKVYDGNTGASLNTGSAAFTGMVGGDSLTVATATGSFADKNAASGKTVNVSGIALGGTDAGNYTLASTTASTTADIAKASISAVGGITANSKVYDGNALASLNTGGASFTGMVGGDNLTVSNATGSFGDKNAANGKTVSVTGIALGGTDAGNYTLINSTASTTADIAKASISAVAGITAGNKVYDGNALASLSTGSASFTGMVGGDNLTVSNATGSFGDKNAASGKTVSVTGIALGGTDAGNYTLVNSTASTTADIAKASIANVAGITANNKVYDGNTLASLNTGSAAFTGMVGGDNLTVSNATGSFGDKNAASGKTVSVTGIALGGADAGNYTLASNTASTTADIAKASIANVAGITANNKVYDGNALASLNTGSAAFTGMVGGDNLTVSNATGSFGDKNAASGKTVNVSGIALGGTDAGNYLLASNTASTTADIAKASISAVGGITANNKVYDGNTGATLNTGSAAFTGMVGGDSLTVSNATGSFGDKNAASGKTVSVTGIALGGTDAGNYTLLNSTASTTADIAKASISAVGGITANNKVYDGNALASLNTGSASFTGMVGGDNLTVSNATGSFGDKNAASGKTVSVTGIALGGTDAGNYTLVNSTASTTADIAKASISAVGGITANNKVYDGNALASLNTGSAAFTGMVGGDSLTVATATGSFADKNAASGKTVSVTGIALGGADAGNYTLVNSTASTTADIAKATIANVSGITAGNKVYDTSTAASLNTGSAAFTGMVGGDKLTVATATGSFADKNAASGKTVSVTGISLGGSDAGNYTLANTTASTTATISRADLTVKVDNTEKDQGRTNPLFTASYTGLLGADTLAGELGGSLAFDTTASTGSVAGMYLVSASGQSSGNYTLKYIDGVLKVNPTEALQSAISSVIGTVNVAPSQGNMVQADMVASGETAPGKPVATLAPKASPEQADGTAAPVVQLAGNVVTNALPGLRLSVVDRGLRLPTETGGNTSQESQ